MQEQHFDVAMPLTRAKSRQSGLEINLPTPKYNSINQPFRSPLNLVNRNHDELGARIYLRQNISFGPGDVTFIEKESLPRRGISEI